MANRPCKPDGDLKKLWQTLMPGVAMPACGTGEEPPERENAAPDKQSEPNDARRSKDPAA